MYVLTYVCIDLIKHLYSDGHITAEEASQLTSKKLFEVPAPSTDTSPPIILSSTAASNGAGMAPHNDAINSTNFSSLLQNFSLQYSKGSASTAGVQSIEQVTSSSSLLSQPGHLEEYEYVVSSELPLIRAANPQPSITVTPNTPVVSSTNGLLSHTSEKNTPEGPVVTTMAMASNASSLESSAQKVAFGDVQSESLAVSDDVSQTTSPAEDDASSNDDHSYYNDLVYDSTPEPSLDKPTNGAVYCVNIYSITLIGSCTYQKNNDAR